MINEYLRVFKARGWMKRNMPFLYSWHAYVGYELDLYESFKKPITIEEVAYKKSLREDLLQRWVEVGISIKYMKALSKGRFKTVRSFMLPSSKSNPRSTGVILKEMMELHIPTLLSYPDIMKKSQKQTFDHDEHGETVAQTSSLLEQLALPTLSRMIKKQNIQSLIDVGCGHGGYLQRLAGEFPDVQMIGIELNDDVAKEAINRCKDFNNIEIKCQDGNTWTPDEKVDLVLVNNLLHYISLNDRQSLFHQLSSWLHDKGVISVITPIQNPKHGKQFSSVFNSFFTAFDNLYPVPTEKEINQLAARAGLTVKEFRPLVKEGGWYRIMMER
ncbi:class I SAM-dependent methyltransferase [Metabacillus iocasae]|uniref:SAM-dependent methyltransferase n=1 Tax=Priestia iocasae TaxID=2291674 RepID=A0ABS2R074_9BACI|nr:class I SAM-dependent methyltransferase [Metabacillus iocasae]MBM7704622.1 SAM-dependent methyltransferase [Metabacillus iocasae]